MQITDIPIHVDSQKYYTEAQGPEEINVRGTELEHSLS